MLRSVVAIVIGLACVVAVVVTGFLSVAIFAGGLLGDPTGDTIDLDPFLWIESIGGFLGAMLGGCVVMKLTSSMRLSLCLAMLLLALGWLEALAMIASPGEVDGKALVFSRSLALSAPVAGAIGAVLCATVYRRIVSGRAQVS